MGLAAMMLLLWTRQTPPVAGVAKGREKLLLKLRPKHNTTQHNDKHASTTRTGNGVNTKIDCDSASIVRLSQFPLGRLPTEDRTKKAPE